MPRVVVPTVFIGIGSLGRRAVDLVVASLPDESDRVGVVSDERLVLELDRELDRLLRVGRHGGATSPRVDLIGVAAVLQGDERTLVSVCERAAKLVADRYGALFPKDRGPSQRSIGLHLVVITPPLAPGRAEAALDRLAAVDAWQKGDPAHPLLARVWLVPQHTTAGTLTVDDLVGTTAGFSLALVGSGLRDSEPMRQRMAHPEPGVGLFGFVSVGRVDLPEGKLAEYARARAVWDGMNVLVDRLQGRVIDVSKGLGAVSALKHEQWFDALNDGDAGKQVKALAWTLSGGASALPDDVRVKTGDQPDDLRARYPVLFRPATEVQPPTAENAEKLDDALATLDQAERSALAAIRGGVAQLVHGTLRPDDGLARLPMVQRGLDEIAAKLSDQLTAELAHPPIQAPDDADPLRAEAEDALEQKPSRARTGLVGLQVGTAFGLTVAVLGLLFRQPPAPTSGLAGFASTVVSAAKAVVVGTPVVPWYQAATLADVWSWIFGLAVLVTGALVMVMLASGAANRRVRSLLSDRRDALKALRDSGVAAAPDRQATAQLKLRQIRVRRQALAVVRNLSSRLSLIQRTLVDARGDARDALTILGVEPAIRAEQDDLSKVLGQGSAVHQPMLPAPLVARWVARCRVRMDDTAWADHLLRSCWPEGGLAHDVVCADPAQVAAVARKQTAPLASENLFADPEAARAAGEAATSFSQRVAVHLAPGCLPVDLHGDPVAGVRAGQILVVAPAAGRQALNGAIEACPVSVTACWSPEYAPRLLFVRTWEGLDLAAIRRGAVGVGK